MAIQRFKFNLFNKLLGSFCISSDMWEVKQIQENGEVHSWHQWLFFGPVTTVDEQFGVLKCYNFTFLWFAFAIGLA